ncbi:MAG: UbiA family prenyltransferase [Granulosicoccus sp.]
MSFSAATFLKLGRVSNLPTVWTNTLAGVVLAGGSPDDWRIILLLLAMTFAYTGGMFLNDAFDSEIDARERPERPIPSGEVSMVSVFTMGSAMLGAGVLLVVWCALTPGGGGTRAIVASVALVAAIVLYNAWHKANPWSPLVMGLCRMLVYITAGWALSTEVSSMLYFGGAAMLCYLIGLTYTAKQENLGEVKNLWPLVFLAVPAIYAALNASVHLQSWLAILIFLAWLCYALRFVKRRQAGDIPKAVVSMIAGISLIDAMFIASIGSLSWVILALLAFGLTLFLQRYISGT